MDVSTSRVVAIFGHKSLFSLVFTSKNGRFYFACSCDHARVVAIFGHKSLFSLDFTSKNGRVYFACSCDLRSQVSVFIGFYQ